MRGRTRDRRASQGLSAAQKLAPLEAAMAAGLYSWTRPEAGGPTTTLPERVNPGVGIRAVDPSHVFTSLVPIAVPANNALISGRPTATFTGLQWFDSSAPASAWSFLHSGAGGKWWAVWVPIAAVSDNILFASRSGGAFAEVGTLFQFASSGGRIAIGNGTGHIVDIRAGTPANSTPIYMSNTYMTGRAPNVEEFRQKEVLLSTAQSGVPSAAAPMATMRIGAGSTAIQPAQMHLADLMFAPPGYDGALDATVTSYIKLRYPVLA